MPKKLNNICSLLKTAFAESRKDEVPALAASLTYYLIFSLAPLFYVVISIGSILYDRHALQGEVLYYFERGIGKPAADFFQNVLIQADTIGAHFWPAVISIIVLLFGAINFYITLERAFHKIHKTEEEEEAAFRQFIKKRALSLMFLVAASSVLVLLIFLNLGVNLLRTFLYESFSVYGLEIFNLLFAFAFVFALLSVIYKILSRFNVGWGNVAKGAAISAFLFVVANFLLGLYFKSGVITSFYGVGGSIILTLIWLYYTSQIFLFGVEIIKVSERKR